METILAPAVALVLGVLGTYFVQHNRAKDKEEVEILEHRKDDASITIAAIEQWQKIVTAQGELQASQAKDMALLRQETAKLREQGLECEIRCRRLEASLGERDQRISELERRYNVSD